MAAVSRSGFALSSGCPIQSADPDRLFPRYLGAGVAGHDLGQLIYQWGGFYGCQLPWYSPGITASTSSRSTTSTVTSPYATQRSHQWGGSQLTGSIQPGMSGGYQAGDCPSR